MRRTLIRTLAPVAALALFASACSDDDDDDGAAGSAPTAAPEGEGTEATGGATTGSVATGATDATTAGSTAGSTTGTAEEVQSGESLLDTVKENDVLRCGVREDFAGFATLDEAGEYVGFDIDFCRVIAAGVLGDATKVEFVPLAGDARFPALQAG